jgi:hypothetical protein
MPVTEGLIQGLHKRNADRERATDGGVHPPKPLPPVAVSDLHVLEQALGFRFPALLRSV